MELEELDSFIDERWDDPRARELSEEAGTWHVEFDGQEIIFVADRRFNRFRFMVPLGILATPEKVFPELMAANFGATMDLRFGVSEGVLFLLYLHPLETLHRSDLRWALEQLKEVLGRTEFSDLEMPDSSISDSKTRKHEPKEIAVAEGTPLTPEWQEDNV